MGLIDKLCLWICKGKLKSVVSLDTDWFARADGIARMKGWKVKHMHLDAKFTWEWLYKRVVLNERAAF